MRGCGFCCRALREQVDLALKGLDLRPRNILRYRYGLHHALGRPLTLNEVRTRGHKALPSVTVVWQPAR